MGKFQASVNCNFSDPESVSLSFPEFFLGYLWTKIDEIFEVTSVFCKVLFILTENIAEDRFNNSGFYNFEDHNFSFIFDEDLEEDEGEIYVFYIDGILLLMVALLGIVGTLMSIVVLLKPRIRDFFSGFLTALSICDALFLILAIPFIGLPALSTW